MTRTRWSIIGRGLAGWHASAADEYSTRSSGGDLERLPWYTEKHRSYLEDAAPGCLVYDARPCEADPVAAEAFIRMVIGGPMVDPSLPPGTYTEPFEYPKVPRPVNGTAMRALHSVATDVYESMLRQIPGIRIGHVKGHRVEWENEP